MSDRKRLEELKPIADEMLAGLRAGDEMKRRVRMAAMAKAPRRRPARLLAPAVCCAAVAIACVVALRGPGPDAPGGVVEIGTLVAGNEDGRTLPEDAQLLASLGDGANVRAGAPQEGSLFASGEGDMPLVAVGGGVYRMLTEPSAVSRSLCGAAVGEVAVVTGEPSLASEEEKNAGLSNVAAQGGAIYAIAGIDSQTAVAAEVDGVLRVFERVSYAGKGPGQRALEEVFSVRGQVKSLALSGVGTLSGEAANAAIDVLLDNAALVSADASARGQSLTVTLENGLKLELGVSGDTVYGCGGWSCPEFFEAFEASL